MNALFEADAFRDLFREAATFRPPQATPGGLQQTGSSRLLKVELQMDRKQRLERATVIFPFFYRDTESDRAITSLLVQFLELCLPETVEPEDWIREAHEHLKDSEERHFESVYDHLTIRLLQLKPKLVFVLQAERETARRPGNRPAQPPTAEGRTVTTPRPQT
jgi:hypothetical protein